MHRRAFLAGLLTSTVVPPRRIWALGMPWSRATTGGFLIPASMGGFYNIDGGTVLSMAQIVRMVKALDRAEWHAARLSDFAHR